MQLSFRALRSLFPALSGTPEEIADHLARGGIGVSRIVPLSELLQDVVVARVESVDRHPNADRLRICAVNDGGDRLLQIITGAPNVEAGAYYPLFRAGTSLPNGTTIRVGKLRGELSEGMLGSAIELELGDDKQGLMTLAGTPAPGTPLPAVLQADGVVFVVEGEPTNQAIVRALAGGDAPEEGDDRGAGTDFIRTLIANELEAGKYEQIITRFPPEPNGFLHIGHAKAVVLNAGIARETRGRFHLRFDDTNPETEDVRYVEAIQRDVRWLGGEWGEYRYFASDYFDEMYAVAEHLIERGRAYVDSASEEEIREARGTVTEPGRPTPGRSRSPEDNLELFRRMRAGEFPDGTQVLRARIDLASPNMLLRDPVLYRIRHAHHYRTGDRWPIYPLYDYAHPIEDAVECVTHSLCTLEFENNRPLYDWVVEAWREFRSSRGEALCRPRQIEFARLNLDYTVTSKRKLLELVRGGQVSGWDDPRLPTVAGLRRRGVTPEAVRAFCEMIGVAKTENRVDLGKLEFAIRDDLNRRVPRVLCVLRPLKVTITNFPEGETELLEAPLYPHDILLEGSRSLPFSRTMYVEREDFAENPPNGFFRLSPGAEVRLRYAYLIRCDEVVRDKRGEVVELRCSYDPTTRSGQPSPGRSVKGTIHWVSAEHGVPCEVRLYDRLFSVPDPEAGEEDFKLHLNPESLVIAHGIVEPSVLGDAPGTRYQFERQGYFCSDPVDSQPDALVFNRTVTLRDGWAKGVDAPARAKQAGRAEPGKAASEPKAAAAGAPPKRPKAPAAEVRRTPELEARRRRYAEELGLGAEEADRLTRDAATADLFEAALTTTRNARTLANWVVHELPREAGERSASELPFGATELGALVRLVEDGTVSSSAAREVLGELVRSGGDPARIVDRLGLRQVSDPDALLPVVEEVIAANPAKADEFRGGKTGLMGFFVGQVMRRSGGRANPELAKQLLEQRLAGAAASS